MKIERVHPGVMKPRTDGPSPKVARGATLSIESHRIPDDGTQHDLSQRCSCGPTIRVEHHEREGQ